MRTRSLFVLVWCVAVGAVTALLFFDGPSLEHRTASFLFSKIRLFMLAGGGRGSLGAGIGCPPVLPIQDSEAGGALPLAARVIFRPPAISYDQVIIDRGERDGIRGGMAVVAGDGDPVLVGSIADVFWDTSRVVAPTSFGTETDVFLESSESVVPATGFGNRELVIRLPRDFPVAAGDRIFTVGDSRWLLGVVEQITGETSSAIKEVRTRYPLNIREVLTVYVVE